MSQHLEQTERWFKSAPSQLSQAIKRLISCLIIGIIVFYVGFCWVFWVIAY